MDSLSVKIPTFSVRLDNADTLADSVRQLQRGKRGYSLSDVEMVNDWTTLCATQYLIDRYERVSKTDVTKKTLQDREFYFLQCHKVNAITASLLDKVNVAHYSWCSTNAPCQGKLTHSSLIADFHPTDSKLLQVHYDQSLRQYFPTTRQGLLRQKRRFGKTADYVSDAFLMDHAKKDVATNLLSRGHWLTGQNSVNHYIDAFRVSMAMTCRDFDPKKGRAGFFSHRRSHPEQEFRVKTWAIMPDDKGAGPKIDRIFARQRALGIVSPS